jgi:hypothetical protein
MQKILNPRKWSGVAVVIRGDHAVFPERRLVFEFDLECESARGAIDRLAASDFLIEKEYRMFWCAGIFSGELF